jgi:hypothetical protein
MNPPSVAFAFLLAVAPFALSVAGSGCSSGGGGSNFASDGGAGEGHSGPAAGDGGAGASGSGGTGGVGAYELPTLDERCDGTELTGQGVLALTKPRYDTVLLIGEKLSGTISPLSIGLSYENGKILCLPHWDPPPGSGAPSMPAHVDVDVAMSFVTNDGAFNEHFTSTLTSSPGLPQATFQHTIPEADLAGSFDPELAGYQEVSVSLSGSFSPDDTSGNVGKSGREPGKTSTNFPFVGQWPAPR